MRRGGLNREWGSLDFWLEGRGLLERDLNVAFTVWLKKTEYSKICQKS